MNTGDPITSEKSPGLGDVGLDGARVRGAALRYPYEEGPLVYESLSLRFPASLFRLPGAVGRLLYAEGGLLERGVARCLRELSNAEGTRGVCGTEPDPPREGGRL